MVLIVNFVLLILAIIDFEIEEETKTASSALQGIGLKCIKSKSSIF